MRAKLDFSIQEPRELDVRQSWDYEDSSSKKMFVKIKGVQDVGAEY